MSLFSIFDIAGSAMSAQTVRLNTTASNLANSEAVSGSEANAYRARQPVFATMVDTLNRESAGVQVTGIVQDNSPVHREYAPDNPLADDKGYIYKSNVNAVEEMANMISASRSYQNSVEVLNTSKQLLMSTLRLGQ
ncbi:MAG: flagellar basal body rod protein FlgC [Gammaproteobacteria bacterium]